MKCPMMSLTFTWEYYGKPKKNVSGLPVIQAPFK